MDVSMFDFPFEEMTGHHHDMYEEVHEDAGLLPRRGRPAHAPLVSSRDEDIQMLDKISSLLHKKRQKTNMMNMSPVDDDRRSETSTDSNAFSSLTSRSASIESGSEDGHVKFTDLERETFMTEGIPLPQGGRPFSKTEERALKRIRRKIKNKLSAQESRRKKKEYVETMQLRLDSCNLENTTLREQVCSLDNTVRSLLLEVQRLQKERQHGNIKPKTQTRGIQTGTCLRCVLKNSHHRQR